jgi:hypothetical protein
MRAIAASLAHPLQLEDELDVLARRQHGHEVVRLEHEAERLQTHLRTCMLGQRRDVLPEHDQFACRRHVERAKQVEQRRLAAARRTDQREKLAGLHLEIDAAKRPHLVASALEHLRQPARDDDLIAHCATLNATAGSVRDAYHAG